MATVDKIVLQPLMTNNVLKAKDLTQDSGNHSAKKQSCNSTDTKCLLGDPWRIGNAKE